MMYKQIINQLVSNLKDRNDSDAISLVNETLKNCWKYIQRVNELEAYLLTKSADTPESYQQIVTELDKSRSVSHDSLISSVKIVNRLCIEADLQPIFSGNIENRIEVAEFAMEVALEIFRERRL
jgi:hypothetical protein